MGFWDDYATPVENIQTGFGLPLGTYPVILSDIKNFTKKDGNKAIVISFTVDTLNDPDGRSGKEDIWLNQPKQGDPNADTNARIGKQTLLAIGVPESELKTFTDNLETEKDKVIGTTGVLNVTAGKGDFTNKKFVKTAEESGVAENVSVPDTKAEAPLNLDGW